MPTANVLDIMTPAIGTDFPVAETSAARHSDITETERAAINAQWDKVIDKFHDWIAHPEEFAEEGMTSPSPETISLACDHIVKRFRKLGLAPPPHVVADLHGGIAFEQRNGSQFESIRVQADGHIEYCRFSNRKLVDRQMWR